MNVEIWKESPSQMRLRRNAEVVVLHMHVSSNLTYQVPSFNPLISKCVVREAED
jgi:hypothetical protein